ncbi:MAG: SulP family inorganic anion transporter, partial [Flavobacteriales bacterium]|nr:SulP family inorganic anion transporter [Flavobacteriales bacterium]
MKKILNNFTFKPKDDILSGLTVALALVPEAVAFSFVAGIDPLVGLYGAFMMGLVTAIFGGRPGMISGATGAMAVVMIHMIQKGNEVGIGLDTPIENLGLQWLFITLLFVGAIQILAGVFKLGKFVRLIPHPVMMGFVNGLAIVIFLSQLGMLPEFLPAGVSFWSNTGLWVSSFFGSKELIITLGLIAVTMLIMYGLPKITKKIPAALTAIIVVASITIFGGVDVSTVGSFIKDGGGEGLQGGFPTFQTQLFGLLGTLEGNWGLILSTAALLAAVGLIESLMTLNLIDEMTESRGSGNRECVAQGGANIINGLFGGMGGCAMIGQSIINVNSGGRGRLSGIVAAIALLCFVLFGAPLIEQIPIAALVGVMFMVVVGTFAWSSFRILTKIPVSDAFVLIAVSAITVWQDLAIAVISGVIIS